MLASCVNPDTLMIGAGLAWSRRSASVRAMALPLSPGLLRTVECLVLLLGGAGLWWAVLEMPDFHNALEYGLGSVRSRSGSVLFGVPLLGTAQFGLALALWRGWGGSWLPMVAVPVVVIDVLLGVGFLVLLVMLSGFHLH